MPWFEKRILRKFVSSSLFLPFFFFFVFCFLYFTPLYRFWHGFELFDTYLLRWDNTSDYLLSIKGGYEIERDIIVFTANSPKPKRIKEKKWGGKDTIYETRSTFRSNILIKGTETQIRMQEASIWAPRSWKEN